MNEQNKNFSIRYKFILTFSILILLSNGIIGYVSYSSASTELAESGKIVMQNGVRMIKEAITIRQNEVISGQLTIEEAQEDIKQLILGPMADDGTRPINSNLNLGEHGYFFILDTDGYEIAHPTLEGSNLYDSTDMADSSHFIVREMIMLSKNGGGFTNYHWVLPYSDVIAPKINYSEFDENWNWVIVASIYLEDFNRGANSILSLTIFMFFITSLVGLSLVFYLSNSILNPISKLTNSISKIAEGDYEIESLDIPNNDETGILATQFNYMLTTLKKEINSRKQIESELEKRVEHRTHELQDSIETLNKTQRQLLESEKMAALGNIVSGVTHEINTPLGASITTVSHILNLNEKNRAMLLDQKMSKKTLLNYMDHMDESANMLSITLNRAAELVRNFKQMAVDQHANIMTRFNLHEYIESTLFSLKHEYKNSGHDIIVYCDGEIFVNSYPGAYSQIITNLLMNSLMHAFTDGNTGTILIRIWEEDDSVFLDFADSGIGIPEENVTQIFDPFFTTRRGQGGSGIGLNLVYTIVTEQLGGDIWCESEIGVGTTFHIYAPKEL